MFEVVSGFRAIPASECFDHTSRTGGMTFCHARDENTSFLILGDLDTVLDTPVGQRGAPNEISRPRYPHIRYRRRPDHSLCPVFDRFGIDIAYAEILTSFTAAEIRAP